MSILQAIGSTSIVRLRKIRPSYGAEIFVKLEWENPTGSLKDRMALAVIHGRKGEQLKPETPSSSTPAAAPGHR